MYVTLLKQKKAIEPYRFDPEITVLVSSEVQKNGQILRQSEFKTVDYHDKFKDCYASDFSISSLLSVGALDRLKTAYMSFTSSMNVADGIENIISTSTIES